MTGRAYPKAMPAAALAVALALGCGTANQQRRAQVSTTLGWDRSSDARPTDRQVRQSHFVLAEARYESGAGPEWGGHAASSFGQVVEASGESQRVGLPTWTYQSVGAWFGSVHKYLYWQAGVNFIGAYNVVLPYLSIRASKAGNGAGGEIRLGSRKGLADYGLAVAYGHVSLGQLKASLGAGVFGATVPRFSPSQVQALRPLDPTWTIETATSSDKLLTGNIQAELEWQAAEAVALRLTARGPVDPQLALGLALFWPLDR